MLDLRLLLKRRKKITPYRVVNCKEELAAYLYILGAGLKIDIYADIHVLLARWQSSPRSYINSSQVNSRF